MVDELVARLVDGSVAGPLLGLGIGALLGVSPVAWPALPLVVGVVSPGRVNERGERVRTPAPARGPVHRRLRRRNERRARPVGYAFVTVAVAITRAAVALNLVAATIMGVLGLRLLLRRTSLCDRVEAIPPRPTAAFAFGVAFSVGGCPGCGPIVLGVGTAAAAIGGPGYGLVIIAAFIVGHAAVLLLAAALGGRILPSGTRDVPWARLDRLVGAMFLLTAAFYLFRVLNGDVTTRLPGEPGSGLLP